MTHSPAFRFDSELLEFTATEVDVSVLTDEGRGFWARHGLAGAESARLTKSGALAMLDALATEGLAHEVAA